jgi:hypothetical protein
MWGTVLVLALMGATDPVRLGIAALLVSRPRPMLNLFTFCLGGIAAGLAAALVVLILLRDLALKVVQDVSSAAASASFRHIQITIGMVVLLIAALIAVGFSLRRRARVPMPGDDLLALALRRNARTAFSRLSARAQDALEGECLWVPFVAGLGSATPPIECLLALTAIAASRAAISTQLSAALMFTIVVFAIVEIPLVSSLAAPARTHAVMLQVHDWLRTRRRRILAVMLAVAGVMLVATGS